MNQPTAVATLVPDLVRPAVEGQPAIDVSIEPSKGWHVSHLFYVFDRAKLAQLSSVTRQAAEEPQTAANAEAATVQPDTTSLEKAP